MAVTEVLSAVRRPIYDRTYPKLKRFSWPWRLLATYTSFLTWLASTPWLLIRSLAPQNLQDNLADMERGFFNFVTPLVNFVQDTTFKAFHIADVTADWAINTATHVYQHNLKGFEHTFDHALRNVEHRVRILKDDGLNGIPKALSFDLHTPATNHRTTTPPTSMPIAGKM
ncbi:hypothetical protein VOLCADRAFT_94281 [Volvox carteri f. nagariensis]|uniref:Uncharacterized protein n=1 Tax=Volvox carteri f. nagariensis TaxID=3068 RepID=D8U431_VOLCA|nr:uncharacterized protein VOLCADRAFT_94281 [Volvox carteri f. nagariensis]EFJ45523.1 hypothetical protein VOLCADRAFT_94281 [Volvox carteri f. nagariensis]|eukprot:XP_002953550.1 hypothetical protein VOLCADRAFT_94281 [Volvox carteri f. nagariensis]